MTSHAPTPTHLGAQGERTGGLRRADMKTHAFFLLMMTELHTENRALRPSEKKPGSTRLLISIANAERRSPGVFRDVPE